ncbi:uncharacterized protein LOC143899154 [Temnothorax americanus]|uniref:uncharacterized protein LOC143899154 n=1 Tax=Temnothorax americanus TaxID=1964332 RepID=UPI004067BEBD
MAKRIMRTVSKRSSEPQGSMEKIYLVAKIPTASCTDQKTCLRHWRTRTVAQVAQ